MKTGLDIGCPCCSGHDIRRLGELPDSRWFAGKLLEQVLSGGDLYRCRTCQLKFRHPLPEAAISDRMYDNSAIYTWPANTPRPDWDLISDHIRKNVPAGGRVLDFGCYSGGLLSQLGSGFELYGVEVNLAAANIASRNSNALVWPSINDIPREMRFDAVILADVIEHLPNPLEIITRISALLNDAGVLIITTGDADNYLWNRFGANWWYCFYPEHVAFLSRASLKFISRETGLAIVRCELFHHHEVSAGKQLLGAVLAHCYGWFPATYLRIGNMLERMRGRPCMTSVAGNGVSADHLFIVLGRTSQ